MREGDRCERSDRFAARSQIATLREAREEHYPDYFASP